MAVFLALSALIHILIILTAGFFSASGGSLLERLFKEKEDDLIVDVIELPPSGGEGLSKEKKPPTHYADRTQSVEKETYPEQVVRAKKPSAVFIPGKGDGTYRGGQAPQEAKGVASPETKKEPMHAIEEKRHEKTDLLESVKTGADEGRTSKTAPSQAGTGPKAQARGLSKEGEPGKPNLFLSEERLSELTKRYEAEAPKGEQGKTLQLNTSELRYQRYLIGMKDRIQLFWEYPDVAARNGWHGRLRIDFVINKDGTVSDIRLVKSSNYPVLDDAAVTALKLASPFQSFPENFAVDSILIRGSFEYSFYGNEGR